MAKDPKSDEAPLVSCDAIQVLVSALLYGCWSGDLLPEDGGKASKRWMLRGLTLLPGSVLTAGSIFCLALAEAE